MAVIRGPKPGSVWPVYQTLPLTLSGKKWNFFKNFELCGLMRRFRALFEHFILNFPTRCPYESHNFESLKGIFATVYDRFLLIIV